ncbi:choice-of-anchor G family protein, partial [Brachybacterium sp. FME24]|uniref:choice-of-anchor G family protein n=1 Tax=Brachybacterium sp. FME24 TaxID=2742605 RepID=UPI001867B4AE
MSVPPALAAEDDLSEALGRVINADALSLDLADAGTSASGFPSDAGPNANPLNVGALDALNLDLGTLTLPLVGDENNVGLLHLGEVGAVSSFAESPDGMTSTASAGAVGEGGALDLDGIENGTYGSAEVDLTQLLDQAGVSGLTDEIVDELSLQLGALGSTANAANGETSSEYVVADGQLLISSPLVGGVSTELDTALTDVGTVLNGAVGTDGALGTIANEAAIDLDIGLIAVEAGGGTIGVSGLDAALDQASTSLLAEPLVDENELVSIDLANGTIAVDLQKLGGADGLNGLPANTELLDADTIALITGAVTEALGTLTERVGQVLIDDVFNNVGLTIELPANVSTLGLPAANVDIVVETTLGQLAGTAEGEPTIDIDGSLLGIIPIGTLLGALTTPVQDLLIAPLQGVVGGVVDTATTGLTDSLDGVINPLLETLSPVLSGVLAEVVSVTINEQPEPGYLGDESFTVNALSLELLPNLAAVNVDLASSTVRAAAEVFEPTVTLDPGTVEDGGTTVVTGEGYPPNTDVSVQLVDVDGNNVGDPVVVTTDGEGGFTTDLVVPEGTEAGDFEVVGTATSGEEAAAPLVVTNAEDPTDDNTAENTEVNTEVNTDVNTEVNTDVNTDVNTTENDADNTTDNTDVNTTENDADNTTDNTDVNTTENDADNTTDNTDVNTTENDADNTTDNTDVNTTENDADNTTDNTDVNTTENDADNTTDNTDVNTTENDADNTTDNTDVNTTENDADNTTDNT